MAAPAIFSAEITKGLADQPKKDGYENHFGLHSQWEMRYFDDHFPQGRFECEMDDLVVYGKIPESIEGTWYRVHPDSRVSQLPDFPFVDGDGVVSAFRIIKGQVSMKVKYVETERYLLERQAGRKLFGRYRNPYDNHPCLRLANDSTANTNVLYWAGDILALSERGLPYAVNPDTLETRTFDPYGGQVAARTFTAHPKIDAFKNSLVTWSTAAKGLRSNDVVTYSINPDGRIENQFWFKQDGPGWTHDGWITENWVILSKMPFKVNSDEDMKKPNADHWQFVPGQPQEFLVAPRHPHTPRPHGWKEGEFRKYITEHGLIVHTGAAWEEPDGTLILESPFTTFNSFPFWNPDEYQIPQQPKSDYVRWTIDLQQPDGSKLPPPKVLYPDMCEFPTVDDRFLTRKTRVAFLIGVSMGPMDFPVMDKVVKLNTETGDWEHFDAAPGGSFAEPVFIPRTDDAPEGDGYLLFYCTRPSSPKSELILLDTKDFSRPTAIIQLPWSDRNQVHGNWVPNPHPGQPLSPLGSPVKNVIPSVKYGPLAKIQ